MVDAGPILVVVGGETKRLQWLTHHVTSQWPNAQVTTLRAGESGPLSRLIAERTPDAVILQADFANEPSAAAVLNTCDPTAAHPAGAVLHITRRERQ